MKNQYVFREVLSNELEQFFYLRLQENKRGKCAKMIRNDVGIDLNIYDLTARHYGIFLNDIPISYCRIIFHKYEYFNPDVLAIAHQHQLFEGIHSYQDLLEVSYTDFHFANSIYLTEQLAHCYQKTGQQVVEASRFVVFGDYKNKGIPQIMTDCILSTVFVDECVKGDKQFWLNCFKGHATYYMRYGFELVGKGLKFKKIASQLAYVLRLKNAVSIENSSINTKYHQVFKQMNEEFSLYLKIELNAYYPNALNGSGILRLAS